MLQINKTLNRFGWNLNKYRFYRHSGLTHRSLLHRALINGPHKIFKMGVFQSIAIIWVGKESEIGYGIVSNPSRFLKTKIHWTKPQEKADKLLLAIPTRDQRI